MHVSHHTTSVQQRVHHHVGDADVCAMLTPLTGPSYWFTRSYTLQTPNLIVGILSITLVAGCVPPTSIKPYTPNTPTEVVHFVKYGDSLSKIALRYTGDMNNYQIIANYNGIKNADLIYPGMTVRIAPHLLSPRYRHMATDTSMVPSYKSSASATTDSKRTTVEGTALGAILGAALGWFTCDKEDRKTCALAGAAVGGVLGGVAGKEVAKRKRAYATTEQYLDSEIMNAKELNRELEKNHEQQVKRVAILEQEVD